jgi:hypothetical protein
MEATVQQAQESSRKLLGEPETKQYQDVPIPVSAEGLSIAL